MKAFITGMTGFAGSHLAEHLLESGDQVMGCSRRGGWGQGLEHLAGAAPVLSWDVCQSATESLRQRIDEFQPECVFHLAGMSVPADCGGVDPTPEAVATNVGGTLHAIELVRSLSHKPRLICCSSCHVYAPVSDEQPLVDEKAEVGPSNAYGKTKLAAENALAATFAARDVDAIIVRPFNHSGPRQEPRMMLPQWAQQLVLGVRPLQVVCLDSYIDLTDVRDVVRAYRMIALQGAAGEVYNVGRGAPLRSGDILDRLLRRYDAHHEVEELSPGRRQMPIADLTALKSTIDWLPKIPLDQTLDDTLRYWTARENV